MARKMRPIGPPWIDTREAAEMLGCSLAKVRQLAYAGALDGYRLLDGGRLRIYMSSVRGYLRRAQRAETDPRMRGDLQRPRVMTRGAAAGS